MGQIRFLLADWEVLEVQRLFTHLLRLQYHKVPSNQTLLILTELLVLLHLQILLDYHKDGPPHCLGISQRLTGKKNNDWRQMREKNKIVTEIGKNGISAPMRSDHYQRVRMEHYRNILPQWG